MRFVGAGPKTVFTPDTNSHIQGVPRITLRFDNLLGLSELIESYYFYSCGLLQGKDTDQN